MNRIFKAFLVIIIVCSSPLSAYAADIIPWDRRVEWAGNVGVPGGIPQHWPNCTTSQCNSIAPGGSGTVSTWSIQAAVDSAPMNSVVRIRSGRFALSSAVNLKSNVIVRGQGPDNTIFDIQDKAFSLTGNSWSNNHGNIIVGGATLNSSQVVVSNLSGLSVDKIICFSRDNETWVSGPKSRSIRHMAVITNIDTSTKTITFSPALTWNFNSGNPAISSYDNFIRFAGVEDLKLDGSYMSGAYGIYAEEIYGCWFKNISTYKIRSFHMMVINGLLCEIRNSYFNDSHTYGPNNAGISLWSYYGGAPSGGVTGFKIENNIFYRNFPAVELQYSCNGNYIGYNYVLEVRVTEDPNNMSGAAFDDNHGNHNMMNLYEGNVGETFQSDGYFGSSSHGTLLRNHFTAYNPHVGSERNFKAIDLCAGSTYYNAVGNVLGSDLYASEYYEINLNNFSYNISTIFRLGYPNMGNNGYDPHDNNVKNTLLRWGNYDKSTNTTRFEMAEIPSGVSTPGTQTIPKSYYYSSKPAWWDNQGAGRPWPPIGPDVPGFVIDIPAKSRFEGQTYGGGGGSSYVQAPRNLRVAPVQ